jgi:hypothetical protein
MRDNLLLGSYARNRAGRVSTLAHVLDTFPPGCTAAAGRRLAPRRRAANDRDRPRIDG